MNIHILFNFHEGPWGGGNQFLTALRDKWRRLGVYSETLADANIVMMNSYPFGAEKSFNEINSWKRQHPQGVVVYRLNGPISHIRQRDKQVDRIIARANMLFADGIIFQSKWCERENQQHFGISSKYQTVIYNAPDKTVFYAKKSPVHAPRVKLIATSWSANWRKGFDVYSYLDECLDFSKYAMTFVGNSPVAFNNIKTIKPVSSEQLAPILRDHDIFITASKTDPCSNSLVEALSCGLPAVALNDGGHPELVGDGGELFNGTDDVLQKIEKVANNYGHYLEKLPLFDLAWVAQKYYDFSQRIWQDTQTTVYVPKQPSRSGFIMMKGMVLAWKIQNLAHSIYRRIWKTSTGSIN